MPQHLREAAHRRHQQTLERATAALAELSAAGASINFASVARKAGTSTDFLYRHPQLRSRIQQLRTTARATPSATTAGVVDDSESSTSAPVRALSTQLKDLRRRHREEIETLKKALAVAQGENLVLRRRLAAQE